MTLADIATFRPASAAPSSEPNGWGVVGLDVNFLTSAAPQVVGGTLLGRPATVRFTPAGFSWTYGDGASRTVAGPGATWQQLGSREFDPTASSHVYRANGDYAVGLTVQYAAEYSWGDAAGFTPIDGAVTAPGGTLPVHIATESTVLVGQDCTADPRGPGC